MPYSGNQVISVSDFVKTINLLISEIEPVWIEGEIIGLKNWKDRVVFFDIKDKESVLHCSIYFSRFQSVGLALEDGMKIKVIGEPQLRGNRGVFNLNVRDIQLSGEGSFKKAYELLKAKLVSEGLFERKRKIPDFTKKVGVITSKEGAVIHDFRKNLKKIGYQIYFYDALVEGEKSASSLNKAVQWFNENRPDLDVLIIMRGGGSLESLQGFNNEVLARSIYGSKIPTLCGIGHEKDIPLASLVADVSVSTPTAVANYLNNSWDSLEKNIPFWEEKIQNQFNSSLEKQSGKIDNLAQRMSFSFNQVFNNFESLAVSLYNIFSSLEKQRKMIEKRLKQIKKQLLIYLGQAIKEKTKTVKDKEKYLKILNPENNLKLGYGIVFDENDKIIKNIESIKKDDIVKTKLYRGSFLSKINKINKNDKKQKR